MKNCIEISIKNNRTIRFSQTDVDKIRCGVALETISANGEVERRDFIGEEEIVNMVNRYRYVMDNDIKDDIINPTGFHDEEDSKYEEYEELEELER